MGISRSIYYETPVATSDDTAIVQAITAICDEFEYYGWSQMRPVEWAL
jgi:putative transposase